MLFFLGALGFDLFGHHVLIFYNPFDQGPLMRVHTRNGHMVHTVEHECLFKRSICLKNFNDFSCIYLYEGRVL